MNIVIVETSNNTITVGVNEKSLQERAADAGTWGGIEILDPLFWVETMASTATNADKIPINIPADPSLLM